MFFEFGFKTFDQGKGIGGSACKTGENAPVIQFADFSCGSLDNDIAECDLTVSTQSSVRRAGLIRWLSVKLFHLDSCDD